MMDDFLSYVIKSFVMASVLVLTYLLWLAALNGGVTIITNKYGEHWFEAISFSVVSVVVVFYFLRDIISGSSKGWFK